VCIHIHALALLLFCGFTLYRYENRDIDHIMSMLRVGLLGLRDRCSIFRFGPVRMKPVLLRNEVDAFIIII
jgi:hypothetical protein